MGFLLIKIQQVWWHVEDQVKLSPGRAIRQVLDICTDQQFFHLPISSYNIVGLKVIGRNINKELAFIEYENKVEVNLGSLEQWPCTIGSNANNGSNKIRHVKLEVKYIHSDPKFIKSWKQNYKGAFGINGPTRPEFYITAPLGMKLEDEGKNIEIFLVKRKDDEILDVKYYKSQNPHVIQKEGKRKYNFIINSQNYEEIREEYKKNLETSDYKTELVVIYKMVTDDKFYTIPFFGFALVLLPASKSIFPIIIDNFNLSFVIILVAFSTILLTLSKEGYVIPFRNLILFFLILSIFEFLFIFIIPQEALLNSPIELRLILQVIMIYSSFMLLRIIR
jgi:hypothetical protein